MKKLYIQKEKELEKVINMNSDFFYIFKLKAAHRRQTGKKGYFIIY